MANFFTKLFSSGASSLVEAVGEAIDKNVTSDEEKKELENELAKAAMQYELEMAALSLEEKKAVFSDIASARVNQSRVQESEHASWLAKNVHPMLAIGIIVLTFFMFFIIIFGSKWGIPSSETKHITIYILGALTTISTQVVAYFFGSSQGSKDKQKSLHNITAKITQTPQ